MKPASLPANTEVNALVEEYIPFVTFVCGGFSGSVFVGGPPFEPSPTADPAKVYTQLKPKTRPEALLAKALSFALRAIFCDTKYCVQSPRPLYESSRER